jgi:hypothetical protein
MGMGGLPVRGAGGDVGATQQGRIGVFPGDEHWEYVAMVDNGGSPRRGQDDALDGGMRCRGWGFGLAGEGDPIGAEYDHARGWQIASRGSDRDGWVARTRGDSIHNGHQREDTDVREVETNGINSLIARLNKSGCSRLGK